MPGVFRTDGSVILRSLLAFCVLALTGFAGRHLHWSLDLVAEIGNEVAAWHGAKLLVGDFNAAPWGFVMNEIATRGQLQILGGPGGTWPSALPQALRIPIDHMLAGHGLSFVSREVLPFAGSDHVPVLASVAVTDPSKCQPGN